MLQYSPQLLLELIFQLEERRSNEFSPCHQWQHNFYFHHYLNLAKSEMKKLIEKLWGQIIWLKSDKILLAYLWSSNQYFYLWIPWRLHCQFLVQDLSTFHPHRRRLGTATSGDFRLRSFWFQFWEHPSSLRYLPVWRWRLRLLPVERDRHSRL